MPKLILIRSVTSLQMYGQNDRPALYKAFILYLLIRCFIQYVFKIFIGFIVELAFPLLRCFVRRILRIYDVNMFIEYFANCWMSETRKQKYTPSIRLSTDLTWLKTNKWIVWDIFMQFIVHKNRRLRTRKTERVSLLCKFQKNSNVQKWLTGPIIKKSIKLAELLITVILTYNYKN